MKLWLKLPQKRSMPMQIGGSNMVTILKHPTENDWAWCKTCALNTVGKKSINAPNEDWKKKLIASEHSPLRELWFGIKMEIPYWISVH